MSLDRRLPMFCAVLGVLATADGEVVRTQDPAKVQTDLDRFMARVLERRDETWRTLHDYVLDETERLAVTGPKNVRLHGMERQFTWYVRDGYLVRSPLRVNGATLSEAERRRYEEEWLRDEKARAERRRRNAAAKAGKPLAATEAAPGEAGIPREGPPSLQPGSGENETPPPVEAFLGPRGEPRFVSESYFLRFRFEPGNYYFAGQELLDGRDVVRVEYYPTTLFRAHRSPRTGKDAEIVDEEDLARNLNKVALVTLWIDRAQQQIVRYTFDNVDFGFLPGRWLVRVDKITGSLTMANVFEGVWLPKQVTMQGSFTLANGTSAFEYAREFSNYRKAETKARIRGGTGDR